MKPKEAEERGLSKVATLNEGRWVFYWGDEYGDMIEELPRPKGLPFPAKARDVERAGFTTV